MRRRELVRALPYGIICLVLLAGLGLFIRWMTHRDAPAGDPPAAGQTLLREDARKLHPKRSIVEGGGERR